MRIPAHKPTSSPEQMVVSQTSQGIQIRLRVKPNSNEDRITDIQSHCVHVAVSEPAREGEANRGVIELMSNVRRFSEWILFGSPDCDDCLGSRHPEARRSHRVRAKEP